MRAILDTNIHVSALLNPNSDPGRISLAWRGRSFQLLVSTEQLDEIRATLRKPRLRAAIKPHQIGRLFNDLSRIAELVPSSPRVHRSPDPTDDFLLAMCAAGSADFLVTGDKHGLLALGKHGRTRIVSAKEFANLLR